MEGGTVYDQDIPAKKETEKERARVSKEDEYKKWQEDNQKEKKERQKNPNSINPLMGDIF